MSRYDPEAARDSRSKIPVTEREFLWVQDDDKGEVILHVGPTMVSPTAADRVVIDDGRGGFTQSPNNRPQRMIEVTDAQYAVLFNPLVEREAGHPNGLFRPNRNEPKQLQNGTRAMLPGPCSFYLRPGQRCEVRDAHELASNQYLVVKVYGEVEPTAPYFKITARSAQITSATVEEDAPTDNVVPSEINLTRGQLIVIRGLDTQLYIPPTGVDVVPDLSIDDNGRQITADAARRILKEMPLPPEPTASGASMDFMAQEQEAAEEAEEEPRRSKRSRRIQTDQSPRSRQAIQQQVSQRPAPPPRQESRGGGEGSLTSGTIQAMLNSPIHRSALEREVRKNRLIRQAVVLGEKEFCVILDADGKRQIKVGPARVFPGPYDTFLTEGSNNRIYYAYELLPQRGLWLRFIRQIPREKLAVRLPRGAELPQEIYYPGDEMILTGVNSFFFPFNEIEILTPLNGQPHFGNDHTETFIEAIGIDQKSGIYVRDLESGEARLVRGKRSYLVDPRKEVQITRRVPTEQWNLWVAEGEPHKKTLKPMVTPWAISITVPPNTAIMAASSDGYRVIQGPCMELLEYEETLVSMTLSTGTPKSDKQVIKTCFLRTVGNRVTDVIRAQTADFVELHIRVSYQVTFDASHKDQWFTHENYVGVICDHLRSLVRSRCRQMSLTALWPNVPGVIRDTILGEKTEQGRTGRLFGENGMRVTEVEVLSSTILDQDIASLLEGVQRESVSLHISDRQGEEKLRSEKLRHDIERQRMEMLQEARTRRAALESVVAKLEHERELMSLTSREAVSTEGVRLQAARVESEMTARLAREHQESAAKLARSEKEVAAAVEADRLRHAESQAHAAEVSRLRLAELAAQSAATVAERQAVQPALVEALTAVGDKMLLEEVAANMNLISLFQGKDVASILQDVVGGTRLGRTIEGMLPEK
ncbi:MAG: major vault protein [Myxococcota bacterium]|jgi:major vault protein